MFNVTVIIPADHPKNLSGIRRKVTFSFTSMALAMQFKDTAEAWGAHYTPAEPPKIFTPMEAMDFLKAEAAAR